jgi:hypothetical protein
LNLSLSAKKYGCKRMQNIHHVTDSGIYVKNILKTTLKATIYMQRNLDFYLQSGYNYL